VDVAVAVRESIEVLVSVTVNSFVDVDGGKVR
jgi:hypothetical protein